MKHIGLHTLYGQIAQLLIIKASGTYSYHWALKQDENQSHSRAASL
jgi:hypothetical protein